MRARCERAGQSMQVDVSCERAGQSMQVDARERIEEALKDAIRRELPQFADVTPTLERPRNPEHGDFATPDALNLAKKARQHPRKLAEAIAAASATALGDVVTAVETAGPRLLHFRPSPAARPAVRPRALPAPHALCP